MFTFLDGRYLATFGMVLACSASAHGATFYVDGISGNDANSGTSPALAWSSFAPVNQHKFGPADQILFHGGQSWTGVLELHGSGTADRPVVLGSYGDPAKPIFKGAGADATLVLRDVSGWTIEDIAITNRGPSAAKRMGILIHTSMFSSDIRLVRVDVSDVNGEIGSKSSGGIGVYASGDDTKKAWFDDVLIDHCTISHVDGEGIWFQVNEQEKRSYLNTRIRITDTTITDTGRNAIYMRGSLGALIDHNVVRLAATHKHGNAICVGWAKDTVVRDNEVSDTGVSTGSHENGAFDVDDGAIGTIVEYNWSHDNIGGMVNAGARPDEDCDDFATIIRYNLSENDGIRVFGVGGAIHNTLIYNNTVYIGKGHTPHLLTTGQYTHYPQIPDGILFARNVIFSQGNTGFEWNAKDILADGNCYLGRTPGNRPHDLHVVIDKGSLRLGDVPIHDRSEAMRYRIPLSSACAIPSQAPSNPGSRDLLGAPLDGHAIGIRGAIVASPEE
jgi:hypothetical protein